MLVDEAAGSGLGDLVCAYGNVLGSQPVTEMLGGTEEYVDEAGGVATADEELSEGVKESAKRVGAESMDVMSVLEERVEHGCPPKNEKSQGEHPFYAELCLRRNSADSEECTWENWPDASDSA